MNITEVKIKLISRAEDKLLAFASVTFECCFVVRDIKVIQGNKGLFVAMPSRKITDRCPKCSYKNHLQAKFCNQCGKRLPPGRSHLDGRGRAKLHAHITHPINSAYRSLLQAAIVKGYEQELERSKQSNYVAPKGDDWDISPSASRKPEAKKTPRQNVTAPAAISAPAPIQKEKPTPTKPPTPPPPAKPFIQDAPSTPPNTTATPPGKQDDDGNGFGVFG